MRQFTSLLSILVCLIAMTLAGCKGGCAGCGKKAKKTAPATEPGPKDVTESPKDVEEASNDSGCPADTPRYLCTQHDVSKDVADSKVYGDGPGLNKTRVACPRGASGEACSKENAKGRWKPPSCSYKALGGGLNDKDLCKKITSCGKWTECRTFIRYQSALLNVETINGLKSCIQDTACDAIDAKSGRAEGGLFDHCLNVVKESLPASETELCGAMADKFQSCGVAADKLASLQSHCTTLRFARPEVTEGYRACLTGDCGALEKCIGKAGCNSLRLE
ncbi:MAG: hypothetical protein CMH54_04270 [Myxococcales bacterium]|nr:hypothetical protein [Myxococcales bacterium]